MQTTRVVVEAVTPQVDSGRFPAKRILGETLQIEAMIYSDRHEAIAAGLCFRPAGPDHIWQTAPMQRVDGDLWRGTFRPSSLGKWEFTIVAWVDEFENWQATLRSKQDPGLVADTEWSAGAQLAQEAACLAGGKDREQLEEFAYFLATGENPALKLQLALDDELARIMGEYPRPAAQTRFEPTLSVLVERPLAGFSSFYLLFPRSPQTPESEGTLQGCIQALDGISAMGFDVVCLPPIHPIGTTDRRGKNGAATSSSSDVGNPWEVGSTEGGHTALDPRLGTIDDFRKLVVRARELGLEVAMTLAFHCSADHPWIDEHPEWFLGPAPLADGPTDGTTTPAETIHPFDFDRGARNGLWEALRGIVFHWLDEGVHCFLANPLYGQPFGFWEWLLGEVRQVHPEAVFVAHAFARPIVMERFAKIGFSQVMTTFPFKCGSRRLVDHLEELRADGVPEFLRPTFWPNTPDLLSRFLQRGGKTGFSVSLFLASMLSPSYGIYGPAFEMREAIPVCPGTEKYLNSEKYEVRNWNPSLAAEMRALISRLNRIRRSHPALQTPSSLRFHETGNPYLLCFTKGTTPEDLLILAVNLDCHQSQSASVTVDLDSAVLLDSGDFWVHDLWTDTRSIWNQGPLYLKLDPFLNPAAILRLEGPVHTEKEFFALH